ncbi:hypothetical protein BBW65_06455 [Helicobacter enhydrae]|uniref:ATP synthase epsilon chain n=1 Tax=Helicobacter enhydrae TaxID=222136 RepID=A0A1B1U6S0_9HELI|nr:ATP synthase F1 subunit epsilon [Helicobacter enhydrae]ANV98458.1 hypothetical protein BBW65_06455 [Helicobacter enhydrae]
MEEMKVNITTPEGTIFDQEATSVTLPGIDGEFGVQYNHCDLVTLLKGGVIEIIKNDGAVELVAIDWGYAKVNAHSVDILAHGASALCGDVAQNLAKAKELLQKASMDNIGIASALYKLDKSANKA